MIWACSSWEGTYFSFLRVHPSRATAVVPQSNPRNLRPHSDPAVALTTNKFYIGQSKLPGSSSPFKLGSQHRLNFVLWVCRSMHIISIVIWLGGLMIQSAVPQPVLQSDS